MATLYLPKSQVSGGRLKTRSLDDLAAEIGDVRGLFRNHGVEITPGYLADSLSLAEKVAETWVKEKKDTQESLSAPEKGKLLVAYRMASISKRLSKYQGEHLAGKLRQLNGNTLDPATSTVSQSREVLFELETLARILSIDKAARLRDGAGSDIIFTHRAVLMQCECKYVNSSNAKAILDRAEKASDQSKKLPDVFALIAIEIDPHVPHAELGAAATPKSAWDTIEAETKSFVEANNPALQQLIAPHKEIKGVLLMGHANGFIDQKYCVDVGICWLLNSAATTPPKSRDFNLIESLQQGLQEGL